MASETLWTCDVCGATATGPEARARWRRLEVRVVHLDGVTLRDTASGEVCSGECAGKLAARRVLVDVATPARSNGGTIRVPAMAPGDLDGVDVRRS